MSPDGVQGQSPCERGVSPDGVQGQSPCINISPTLLLTTERGERGGAAAAPAGRRLPQEARAARSLGKAKACF